MTVQGLFCPCFGQYSNATKVGMYKFPGKESTNLCTDLVMTFGVFMFPLAIYVMLIGGFWVDGFHSLAACIWVAFVVLGATHRMYVRRKYDVKGAFPTDAVAYACCYCLALRQETLQCEEEATATI